MSSEERLSEIAAEVSTCAKCDLCKGRTKAVPGEGNPHAKLLFIGEGPGYYEDKQGRPFVGPSGQLLEELLQSINLKRSDVFITNVVKCRPPENRDPLPDEVKACSDYLDRQIATLQPQVIVTLGVFRWRSSLPERKSVRSMVAPAKKMVTSAFPCFTRRRPCAPRATKSPCATTSKKFLSCLPRPNGWL